MEGIEIGLPPYEVGDLYTVYMEKSLRGYQGHYCNKNTGRTYTFEAIGMSKKEVIKHFWDRVKE